VWCPASMVFHVLCTISTSSSFCPADIDLTNKKQSHDWSHDQQTSCLQYAACDIISEISTFWWRPSLIEAGQPNKFHFAFLQRVGNLFHNFQVLLLVADP
jgi:hypothetical protein